MSDKNLIAECSQCGTCYTRFKKLKRHFKKKHANLEVFQCYFCDYMTHEKIIFKQHKEMLHPDKKFVCKKCNFKTRKWERIERHFDKHLTKSTSELPVSEHIISVSEAKETVQEIVDQFIQLRYLQSQENMKTYFQCDHCEKNFKSKSMLENHLKCHFPLDFPFKCSVCDYAGKKKCYLTLHMKAHSGYRPYKCSLCDFSAIYRRDFTAHMWIHTGERPIKCHLCEYRCRQPSNLTDHLRYHFNFRNFSCEICDYKTHTKQCLQRHMRTHTGEKPYQCHVCEKAFSQKCNLNKHLESVHLTYMN